MVDIDWQGIADAIRERRFEDITPEALNQVADLIDKHAPKKSKIETTTTNGKQGKGRPQKPKPPKWNKDITPKENSTRYFEYLRESMLYKRNKEPTAFDECFKYGIYEIEELYENFHKHPLNSNEALEKVCKSLPFAVGAKTIEALLTGIRADRKASNEAQEAERKS